MSTALLQGYEDKPPAGVHAAGGLLLQQVFPRPRHQDAEAALRRPGDLDDGSPATVAQYAKDVSTFLMWAAEPHMEARKRLGMQVFVFLILLAGLLYFTKKKVWADAH